MPKAVLATLADENYVEQAKQLISSVYYNSGWEGDYLLLSHGILEDDLEWFMDHGIEVHRCPPLHEGRIGKWPPTLLSKFYLFTEKFRRWDHVLFLDGDITVEASLSELGSLEGFNAVADVNHIPVRDQFIKGRMVSKDPISRKLIRELEDDHETGGLSFNAGIFSFSTDLIRKDTFQVLMDLFNKYRQIVRFPEQAILNLHFSGRWLKLPIIYNNYYIRIRRPWRFGTETFDGICNHFIKEKPWISKDKYFYPKWERNLKLADSINLERRKGPARIWSKEHILKMSQNIEDLMVKRSLMTQVGDGVMMGFERSMGIGGKVIKKFSPTLYKRLKGTGYFGDEL